MKTSDEAVIPESDRHIRNAAVEAAGSVREATRETNGNGKKTMRIGIVSVSDDGSGTAEKYAEELKKELESDGQSPSSRSASGMTEGATEGAGPRIPRSARFRGDTRKYKVRIVREFDPAFVAGMNPSYLMRLAKKEKVHAIVVAVLRERENGLHVTGRLVSDTGLVVGLPVVRITGGAPTLSTGPDPFVGLSPEDTGEGTVFRLFDGTAKNVGLEGSFNDWKAEPMSRMTNERKVCWMTRKDLPSGRYAYRFVVDGIAKTDPLNSEFMRPSEGGVKSFLIVP